jgi:hypothetical protein
VSARMKYRGGVIRQTSSGAAEYSVLGSFASSRASCMMRLTAGGSYEKTRRDKSAKNGAEKEDKVEVKIGLTSIVLVE